MILVDVYLPSVDATYDFILDESISVEKIVFEISEMVSKKMKNEKIDYTNDFFLYSMKDRKLLRKELSLHMNGIKDGDKLMLV